MTGRERVKKAMHYLKPDKVPVQFYYTPVGYYEHGDKLNDLYETLPGDFEPFTRYPIPKPDKSEYNEEGNYHAFRLDEWGTLWQHRIFGIAGIPAKYPLDDLSKLKDFVLPDFPSRSQADIEAYRQKIALHQRCFYFLQHTGSLFERLIALRPDVDVLCDIELNEPEINQLADMIIKYNSTYVERGIAAKADGISFGDDYGTERGLIMSPKTWRSFIKPRLRKLFAPAVKANMDIHFHSCGKNTEILEDLREVGVTSIWPQLPAYDMEELASRCRSLGLAVAVHTDRARTMTFGTPQMVCDLVRREYDVFCMEEGGAWFYIEADNGVPFANLEALVQTIRELRKD